MIFMSSYFFQDPRYSRLTDWLEVEVDDDVVKELAAVQTSQVLLRHRDPTFTGRRRILDQPEGHIRRAQSEDFSWTLLLFYLLVVYSHPGSGCVGFTWWEAAADQKTSCFSGCFSADSISPETDLQLFIFVDFGGGAFTPPLGVTSSALSRQRLQLTANRLIKRQNKEEATKGAKEAKGGK